MLTPMIAYSTTRRWSVLSTAAAAAVSMYMVKELGRREVVDVNMPELTHSRRRKMCAAFWQTCMQAALQTAITYLSV